MKQLSIPFQEMIFEQGYTYFLKRPESGQTFKGKLKGDILIGVDSKKVKCHLPLRNIEKYNWELQ